MRSVWRPVGLVLSACLLLWGTGCYSAQQVAGENGARLVPGMTMQEVADELGNPDQVIKGDPGSETVWIYRYEGGPSPGLIVLFIVLFVLVVVVLVAAKGGGGGGFGGGGGGDGPPYQIRLAFDPQGFLFDVSPPHPVPHP